MKKTTKFLAFLLVILSLYLREGVLMFAPLMFFLASAYALDKWMEEP